MGNELIFDAFRTLSTALIADACIRLDVPVRLGPPEIRPLAASMRLAGGVRPVRHAGSVDVFLEAVDACLPGEVLVIDNGGLVDEGCIGDLTALEVRAAEMSGIVVWGCHRDTRELLQIGLPVFSCGPCPLGPRRLDPAGPERLSLAFVGEHMVTRGDVVFADADGVLFISGHRSAEVLGCAQELWQKERGQAVSLGSGRSLRMQFQFAEYLHWREADSSYTFRKHLREINGAIEA